MSETSIPLDAVIFSAIPMSRPLYPIKFMLLLSPQFLCLGLFEALKLIRVVSLSKISVIQYLWQLSQIRLVIKLEHSCIYESVSSCEPFTGSLNSAPLSNFRTFSYLQIGKFWSNKRSLEAN